MTINLKVQCWLHYCCNWTCFYFVITPGIRNIYSVCQRWRSRKSEPYSLFYYQRYIFHTSIKWSLSLNIIIHIIWRKKIINHTNFLWCFYVTMSPDHRFKNVVCLFVVVVIFSGSDGVFDINSTSGCISLTTQPGQLRSELYEVRVKVWATSPHCSEPPPMLLEFAPLISS